MVKYNLRMKEAKKKLKDNELLISQYVGAKNALKQVSVIFAFRISDLIKELQKAKRKFGDLEIEIHEDCKCSPECWKFIKRDWGNTGEGMIVIEADEEKLKDY